LYIFEKKETEKLIEILKEKTIYLNLNLKIFGDEKEKK
jgi:hypothetical protein